MTWDVPGYSVVRVLSEGPAGRVVQAVRDGFGEQVVILDRAELADDDARLLATLRDPHVVRVHEYVEGRRALVMELVDGVTLERLIGESGPMALDAALRVLKGCLLGLAAAHQAGIVHRNLTPANVLVVGGACKVTGFGLAVRGTSVFTAPERRDGSVTAGGDLYSAAAVFYQCLTGRPPGERGVQLERLPERARALVVRGMAQYPPARPKSAAAYAALVDAVARNEWTRPQPPAALAAQDAPVAPEAPEERPGLLKPLAGMVALGLVCGFGTFGIAKAFGDDEPAHATPVVSHRPVQPGTGVSRGRLAYTINPAARVVGAAKALSPTNRQRIDVLLSVTPSQAHPGNTVTVRMVERRANRSACPPAAQGKWGWSVGDGHAQALWLYPASAGVLPSRPSDRRVEAAVRTAPPKTAAKGCGRTTVVRSTYTFKIDKTIKPGSYLLSPWNPPRVARIFTGTGARAPLAAARATNRGRLPALTVR
ncbi:protein kinase domain-containing protein [Actinomadura rubrisoli]|uniref:non-specific serine/threonine protein kinase n=1 Tax=Actinomadura rubrisoli TaxID=2530368 RepID=A0A4R5CFM9_9ACTN|nr:serine/threonine-protein kinase [Actinomadura rubrisoli]TDD96044.1 serine/threonine protein kinase [Actinomadura rubrisoli]